MNTINVCCHSKHVNRLLQRLPSLKDKKCILAYYIETVKPSRETLKRENFIIPTTIYRFLWFYLIYKAYIRLCKYFL